jgi:hypothetical protein
MARTKSEENEDPKLAKMVRVFLKMRAKKEEIAAAYKEQEAELNAQMDKIKAALLDYCRENGVEGARTKDGLFYRTVTTKYWTNDWESLGRFVVENNMPELFEKRLHQGNVKQLLEENPEIVLPGLNVDSSYQIGIRRK